MKFESQPSQITNSFFSFGQYINPKFSKHNSKDKNLSVVFILVFTIFFINQSFAQLTENFDSGIPSTWTLIDNGVGTLNWSATTDGYLGTNGTSINLSADNIGDQNTAQYFMVTPQISVPVNGEIQFYTKQANEADNGAQYEVRLSTAAQPDVNGFNIPLQTYTEANLNNGAQTNYEKKVIEIPTSIPPGLDIYIAFVAINTQNGATPIGDEWFVDNVSILEGCTEIDEEDVSVDDITVSGAEVIWSHPTATNFEIQILPVDGVPANSGIPVSGSSYTLSNLDEDTEFDIYISAICDNDTQSEFTGPYTFKTLKFGLSCEAPIEIPDISTTPYVFQDNLDQWANPDVSYSTQGANCISGTSTNNYLNGNKIFFSYTPAQDGLISLTQTTFTQAGGGEDNCFNTRSSLFVYDSCADVGVNCSAGIITLSAFDPKTISNLLVEAGQTYIIVVSSELSASAGICFELEVTAPTCAPPSEITYSSLTDNSVNFSWDNIGGFADSWEYMVVPTDSGEPTGTGTATSTNMNNSINTGLAPGTTYDMYVRAVCDGSPGIWSDPSTFTTQCTVFDTPYATDFDDATPVNPEPCWTTIDANGDGTSWSFIGGYATVRTNLAQYENHDLYVSPQITFDGSPKRLKYKYRATQGSSTYSVRLSTTGVGVDEFTTVVVPETTISNTGFIENMVDFPEGITGIVNVAFIVEPNSTETALRFSIDDVVIEDKPSCPDPIDPYVLNSSITTNSAWFIWDAGENETQWQVAIQDQDSGIPTGDGIIVDNNAPYMATDLMPGTRYEYYVRAYCAADDQSQWVGPVPFITLCESYDTPFFESFNDQDPDTQKFCWNTDNGAWVISENIAEISGSGHNAYLISPQINMDGVKELKFKYRAEIGFILGNLIPPRAGLEVLMSTTNTNAGSFSVISPFEVFTHSGYIEKSIIIEHNGPIYIAFRVPPAFTGNASTLNIDDVRITDPPECPNPSDLMVDTVLTDGADLSWSAGYLETAWNVVVQPVDSGVPTTDGVPVTTNSYSATGLDSDTEYEFYVMANCANGDSQWMGPVTFRTTCPPFTTPFVETFNYDSTSESCWTVIDNNADLDTWELDSGAFPYEGDQAAAMFTGHNGQNEDWMISPTITITENQRLRYYYRVNDSFFTEDLEVLLSTNGIGLDQFTTVLYDNDNDTEIINNVEYKVKIINLPAGIVGDVNIAFRVPFFASSGPYRGQTLVIDNINIEDIPECAEVTNVTLNNLTDTGVQVSWDENGSTAPWEISVQPSGTDAPVGDTDPEYLYSATSNPFTVTGLTASTMYDIYVRSVCDGSESEWTEAEVVTTKCSFENLCQYTFKLFSDSDISSTLDITQNNQVTQSLEFTGVEDGESYNVLLCSGVEFSLYFDTIGTSAPQYENYSFEITDDDGTVVYTSTEALLPRTTVYSGYSSCGDLSCPEPTDLSITDTSVMSWTPGGSETQWEVAIQPVGNGTIPQSGTLVSTTSYTPVVSDFSDPFAVTYEYFVRAVCGTDDESFWSGPYVFVRNDDITNAVTLPINATEVCTESSMDVSFINTTFSSEAMSCDVTNGGDIWFDFTAESLIHIFEINSFTGNLRGEANQQSPYPEITMTLYKDNGAGALVEMACTYDKVLVAMYATELVVGDNYKLRLTLDGTEENLYRFSLCAKTPEDLCDFNMAVNGGFESPNIAGLSGVNTIVSLRTVPGWRQNMPERNAVFMWESLNAPGFVPYEGGQVPQVLSEQIPVSPDDMDIKGLYRDFDTSEATLLNYSFAHYARFPDNSMQLLAGPPEGPFVSLAEHVGDQSWRIVSGDYEVPEGQDVTRVFFRAYGEDTVGNLIDAVSFVANNEIITEPFTVDCDNTNANVEANGTGTWIPSDSNPGTASITDANSNTTSITNFTQPGVYTFTWQTLYCAYDIEITYNGIAETPEVESPVEYCLGDTAEQLTASTSDAYNLMWFTQATGGTGSAIAPTPDTSVVNTTSYYAAYVDAEGCEGPRAEIQVVVSESFTPELIFTYDDTCVVATENPSPMFVDGFATGGMFSSTTLTVDATTGVIDISSASTGQHNVIYTFDGNEESCTSAGSFMATITFTSGSAPITVFNYGTTDYCVLSTETINPTLANNFTTGGTYSATTLTVNEATGAIDLSNATVGSHEVTYTVEANAATCSDSGSSVTTVQIIASTSPVTEFTFAEDIYCADSNFILPEMVAGFTTGGLFSATDGLAINGNTGEIDVTSSAVGNYDVTYEIAEDVSNCVEASTGTFNITILDAIEVAIGGGCDGSDYKLTASPVNNSFNTNEATYTWKDVNGNTVGQNSEDFNVTNYSNLNPNVTAPLQFSLTVDFGGCSTTTSYTTERLACGTIPQGISPDGNNKNDTFDLTGYGVNSLIIFNRYGTEVFKHSGTYTDQWFGQTNNGDELPDGTYFYSIEKEDGEAITGWVYINRAQ
ncbi:choice-of-anchor J domain-containing protein [Winogradskyella bathintestinalis]|uniref:Choice-of-anchor J domain-containing protein n=1 Tax=Winogradskyella bathintestinalis TaxID=3035208 RepID=A0ABT7ZVQ3_9FLAO|nr:choice-of-anchor J domain-containing protein [Winogradskyella bathintestinalis]MDN3493097.1 choice-of-anchor J domain-containing protein [Winogradskyella bathintestinalis]